MAGARFISAAAVILAVAACASADVIGLRPPAVSHSPQGALAPSGDGQPAATVAIDRLARLAGLELPSGSSAYGDALRTTGPTTAVVEFENPEDAWELPPPPGSATLVLSVLLPMGAWQLVRTARHWQFGTLPEWYHNACPDQIGHAVPAPFDLSLSLQPVCALFAPPARPDADTANTRFDPHRDIASRLRSQLTLPAAAPRGPPSLA